MKRKRYPICVLRPISFDFFLHGELNRHGHNFAVAVPQIQIEPNLGAGFSVGRDCNLETLSGRNQTIFRDHHDFRLRTF
jgi:hypothetical protein